MKEIDDALKTIGETSCWDTEKGDAQRRMVREKLVAIATAARREALEAAADAIGGAHYYPGEVGQALRRMAEEGK